jgi:hypothetical protein
MEFGADSIEGGIRERVREVIQTIVNEELEAVLGARPSTRVDGQQGYRHGTRARTVTTSLGPTTIEMPRGRLGARAVLVHAMDDPARRFYEHFDFGRSPVDDRTDAPHEGPARAAATMSVQG